MWCWRLGAISALFVASGCLAGTSEPTPITIVTPPPGGPIMETPGPDLTVRVQTLLGVRAETARTLSGEALLVSTTTTTLYLPGPGAAPIDLGPDVGVLRAVAPISGGRHMIAGDNGLFVFGDRLLEPSPLGAVLTSSRASSLLATPDGEGGLELWIGVGEALHLWRGGRTFTVTATGVDTGSASLAFGAPQGSAPAVWVSSGEKVYSLLPTGAALSIQPASLPDSFASSAVTDLAVDGSGTLWVVAGGTLWSRRFDGVWSARVLLQGVRAIAGLPSSTELWIEAQDGIWRHEGGTFRKVPAAPAASRLLDIGARGYALLATDDKVVRIESGREATFDNLTDGELLIEAKTVEIKPEDADKILDVEAAVDGKPLMVLRSPWRVELDPADIDDGFHTLSTAVTYDDDGPPGTGRVGFFVGQGAIPTWRGEIAKISKARCETCHRTAANAHPLTTRQVWIDEIDMIVAAVKAGRMPLIPSPPLDNATISRIEAWRDAGFPE